MTLLVPDARVAVLTLLGHLLPHAGPVVALLCSSPCLDLPHVRDMEALDDFPPDSWDFSAVSESFEEPVEDVPPVFSDFPASLSSFPEVDAPPDPPDA